MCATRETDPPVPLAATLLDTLHRRRDFAPPSAAQAVVPLPARRGHRARAPRLHRNHTRNQLEFHSIRCDHARFHVRSVRAGCGASFCCTFWSPIENGEIAPDLCSKLQKSKEHDRYAASALTRSSSSSRRCRSAFVVAFSVIFNKKNVGFTRDFCTFHSEFQEIKLNLAELALRERHRPKDDQPQSVGLQRFRGLQQRHGSAKTALRTHFCIVFRCFKPVLGLF